MPLGSDGVRNIVKMFFESEVNSWAVLVSLLLASIVEGFGWATIVPLLSVVSPQEAVDMPEATAFTREALAYLGLPMSVGVLLTFFMVAMIVCSLLRFVAMSYVGAAVAELSTGLRTQIINNIFKVRWSYLVDHPLGLFTNAVAGQVQKASMGFEVAAIFFAQILRSLTYLTVAFFISWPLTLAALGVGLFMVVSLYGLVRMTRKAGNRETKRSRELVVFLTDTLISIKPLRAMMRQQAFGNFLDHKIRALYLAIRNRVISSEALVASQEILIVLIFGTAAYLALTQWKIPIAELVVVGLLLRKTTTNITKVQRIYQRAAGVERPYLEVSKLIRQTAALPELNTGQREATLERSCRLEQVSFGYGDQPVLHSVSLDIELGKLSVLTGPSGSGKTTLIDILIGLYTPDSGQVTLDGVPLRDIELQSWRRMVGYVPQELVLFHDSIFANLSLGDSSIGEREAREALVMAGAWDFVQKQPQGMGTVVGQHGAKLSGGQRQRIAIARALITRPRLLILDEVTSALDPATELELCQRIQGLASDTTIVAITHRPAMLDIADRVIRMEDGRITEITDHGGRERRPV
jgi:ATP-binding cassette subfamily C protein